MLPNRVAFLQRAKDLLEAEAEYLLINGNSCVGKSHLGVILYLHFLFQRDKFRVIYIPFHDEEDYLNDLFRRCFFTFYDEIANSSELKILLNLLSDTLLDDQNMKYLYGCFLNNARADGKVVIVEEDQINSDVLKSNLSLKLLRAIKPDKFILISTSTDPNFIHLARIDIHSGARRLISVPEAENLSDDTKKQIIQEHLGWKLEETKSLQEKLKREEIDMKLEFLREKTEANFHILDEFQR